MEEVASEAQRQQGDLQSMSWQALDGYLYHLRPVHPHPCQACGSEFRKKVGAMELAVGRRLLGVVRMFSDIGALELSPDPASGWEHQQGHDEQEERIVTEVSQATLSSSYGQHHQRRASATGPWRRGVVGAKSRASPAWPRLHQWWSRHPRCPS